MRRIVLIALCLLLLSCRVGMPSAWNTTTPLAEATDLPAPTSTAVTPAPAASPTFAVPQASASPEPTFTLTSTPTLQVIPAFRVRYHPDGGLFVGDQVSLEVISPQGMDLSGKNVQVQVDGGTGVILGPADFMPFGLGNRAQATLTWAWDTKGEGVGDHRLTYVIQPDGLTWTETVTLLPADQAPNPQAHWETTLSECCVLFYITGTEGERDIGELKLQADVQAREVVSKFGVEFTDPITVTFLPRVLGHGGFATDEISVSYLDQNYTGTDFSLVLYHEMVHILDARLGGELRPTMLVEGLAVYVAGGHYQKEVLLPRAAALLELSKAGADGYANWYIPLRELTDDFYAAQHEIGYLEAGALIKYMVDKWGWEAFSKFYRNIHSQEGGSQAEAMEVSLQAHLNTTLDQLEQAFLQALHQQSPGLEVMDNLRLTVAYYDTMRRYQQKLDDSAYFGTAWLLDNREMRQRGIVADYLRHPTTPENTTLENMLIYTHQFLIKGDYETTGQWLHTINVVLDNLK